MEPGVEYIHSARVKVGGVEAVAGCRAGDGEPLVNGAPSRVVDGDDRLRECDRRAPAQNRALLGGENEAGGSRRGAVGHREAGAPVEDHAGGCAGNGDGQRLLGAGVAVVEGGEVDRKSTRLNSSHGYISYAVFCLKKKNKKISNTISLSVRVACVYLSFQTSRNIPKSLQSNKLCHSAHHARSAFMLFERKSSISAVCV